MNIPTCNEYICVHEDSFLIGSRCKLEARIPEPATDEH